MQCLRYKKTTNKFKKNTCAMVVNNVNCNCNYINIKHSQADFANLFDDIKDSWNNLGGNDMINSFEKKWYV